MSDEITEDIILDDEPEVSESTDIDFPDKLMRESIRKKENTESKVTEAPQGKSKSKNYK